MKKILFFIIPAFILAIIIILSYQFFFLRRNEKGALQITSNPKSKVYLDDKFIGETPLCKCEVADMLPVGSYTLKIIPNDPSLADYQEKIDIAVSVLTVVDRKFGKGAESEGSVIYLTPLSDKNSTELLVLSFPDKSDVFMDSAVVGQTSLLLDDITESDHSLLIKRNGYKDKAVRIRTPKGYKLTARVYLGIDGRSVLNSSSSAAVSTQITPLPSKVLQKALILQTPNGFLRVRSDASLSASEIDRVTPGETFELMDEKSGWYQIKLEDGEEGWISSRYAEKE
ncbi:MAG: SH3 domain-containing protein [Candidatus Levybacteria bacterium]|nr:SH3 domain-containing protein [Candidatus Levybacteria bacterium]